MIVAWNVPTMLRVARSKPTQFSNPSASGISGGGGASQRARRVRTASRFAGRKWGKYVHTRSSMNGSTSSSACAERSRSKSSLTVASGCVKPPVRIGLW